MNRTAWLAMLAVVVSPAAAFGQMGGMGGMGGNRVFARAAMSRERRPVEVEMDGNHRLKAEIGLGNLTVRGDLGDYLIDPDKLKTIRFLKPIKELKEDNDGEAKAAEPGRNGNRRMMAMQGMMMGGGMQNQMRGGEVPTVRAKVILRSGEEILSDVQVPGGFRLIVDYGVMIPNLDKLRSMTFGAVVKKPDEKESGEGPPRAAGDDRKAATDLPEYSRNGKLLLIQAGDRVTLYDMDSKRTQELSGPKDPPMAATTIQGQDILALALQGPKISRIAAADFETGWHIQSLQQPVEGPLMPIVGQGVAVYDAGRYVYAYSVRAHRWDVAERPEGLLATPVVTQDAATLEGDGHVFSFDVGSGTWKHVDLRSVLHAAAGGRE